MLTHVTLARDAVSNTIRDQLFQAIDLSPLRFTPDKIRDFIAHIENNEDVIAIRRSAMHNLSRLLGTLGGSVKPIPGGWSVDARNLCEVSEEDLKRMQERDSTLEITRPSSDE